MANSEQLITRDVLLRILQSLSVSASRKKTFALRANKDGRPAMARIFKAMAASDEAQRRRVLFLLHGPIGSTDDNISEALAGQQSEMSGLYNALHREADLEGSLPLAHLAEQEKRVGRKNAMLLSKEQKAATAYYVCSFCGYVHEDKAPENCPICQASKQRFSWID